MKTEFETEVVNGFTYLTTADGRRFQVPSGGSPEKEDDEEKETEDGDKGGVGDADADAEDGEKDAEEKDDEPGERAADDKGEKKTGNVGLQKRLKDVIAQRNAYRELGTPEELKKLRAEVAEYKRYEKQIEDEEKVKADEARVKAGQPTVAQQNANLDRLLDQRFGEGAAARFERFSETEKREVARHTRDGLDHLRGKLAAHNLKTDDATLGAWERHIGTEFRGDANLLAQFRNPVTQKDALDEAFNRVRRGLVDPSLVAVGADKLLRAKARKEAAPSSSGVGGNTQLEHFEKLTPPKGLTADQRQAWWEKQMGAAADAMDW